MGFIQQAIDAGYPPELLIPIWPADAPCDDATERKNLGKKPAFWDGNRGVWTNLPNWQKGNLHPEILAIQDQAGANCGLLLGRPVNGTQFYGIDPDVQMMDPENPNDHGEIEFLLKNAVTLCGVVEDQFAAHLAEMSFFVRKTHPYRSGILVQSKSTVLGRKAVNTFTTPSGKVALQLEILGRGQQMVICGNHVAGPIRWRHYSDDRLPEMPVVPLRSVQRIDSYEVLLSVLEGVSQGLHGLTYVSSTKGRTIAERTAADTYTPPRGAIPPRGVPQLIRALECAYNGEDIPREVWHRLMLAVNGCIRAMRYARMITEPEVQQIRQAAISWAMRWSGRASLEYENKKWDEDWARADVRLSGWSQVWDIMVQHLHGQEFIEELQADDFDDLEIPEGANAPELIRDIVGANDPEVVVKPEKFMAALHIPTAELALADELQGIVGDRMKFISQFRTWMTWKQGRGWGRGGAGAQVQRWIQRQCAHYVAKMRGVEGWSQPTCAKLLSQARFDAIDKILQARLEISAAEVDRATYMLQTPEGAFDLRTLQKVSPIVQRSMLDTRCTAVSPEKGETPLFDNLLLHLANYDQASFDYLYAVLGYGLLGAPLEHIFLVLRGPGGNGKSTLTAVLNELMGDYAKSVPPDVIMDYGKQQHKTSLFEVKGRRFALVNELQPQQKWNESRLKSLTGLDMQEANQMHRDPVTFRPEALWIITSQVIPTFAKMDNSIVRRVRIAGTFMKPEQMILNLDQRIVRQEGPALLYKLMQKAHQVFVDGKLPEVPPAISIETDRYLNDQDKFFAWFRKDCSAGPDTPGNTWPLATVMSKFKNYCATHRDPGDEPDALSALDDMSEMEVVKNLRRFGVKVETFKIGKRVDQIVKCLRMRGGNAEATSTSVVEGNVVRLRPDSQEITDLMQDMKPE